MASPEIESQRRAIVKRGFKKDDLYFHECKKCEVRGVEKYVIISRHGGRDIELCCACGDYKSFTRRAGNEDREEDTAFDLNTFLRR